MFERMLRGVGGAYAGENGGALWYCSQTSSPIRPDPGRGSEIFIVPRGRGLLRFLLRYITAATTQMAAPAAPTTIPALAPAVNPEVVVLSEEEDEDAPLVVEDEAADEALEAVAPEVDFAAVPDDDEASLAEFVAAA